MHVALITPSFNGGPAQVTLNSAKGLISRGHRVDLVSFQRPHPERVPTGAHLFFLGGRPCELTATHWMRMASAVNWDPFCLPSPRLATWSCAIASYMARAKPDCVVPNAYLTTATLLGASLLNEVSAHHPDHPCPC